MGAILFQFLVFPFLYWLLTFLPDFGEWFYHKFADVMLFFYLLNYTCEIIQRYVITCKVDAKNKAVLITGCDSGFGNKLARRLDKLGFTVFAGCLDSSGQGAKELKRSCSKRLRTVDLDVTDQQSVDRCVAVVKEKLGPAELWAIVNNAGVLKGFMIELSTMKDFEDCMQVNALGMVRVTKAFLPMLRKSRGRVVNVCSLAGRHSLPFLSPYNMSKFAAVTFTESLSYEMDAFGVEVITVEPEFFKTGMCSKANLDSVLDNSLKQIDPEVLSDYGEDHIRKSKEFFYKVFLGCSDKVDKVITSLESAVTMRFPSRMYSPCRNFWPYAWHYFSLLTNFQLKRGFILSVMKFYGYRVSKTGKSYFEMLLNHLNFYPVKKHE